MTSVQLIGKMSSFKQELNYDFYDLTCWGQSVREKSQDKFRSKVINHLKINTFKAY
jgi:hypothetical protein